MSGRRTRATETAYRALLLLLPPSFRREYGEVMLDTFRQLLREREVGRRGTLSLWWLLARDLAMTFGREWGTELLVFDWRTLCFRLLGLAAILGAAGWFVAFIGPEWEPFGDLGWGQNGLGYRPWVIVAASVLLATGLVGGVLREGARWSRTRLAGMLLLLASVLLIALQAPLPMGGVSFFSTPPTGLGVYLLPVAVAVLAVAWARPFEGAPATPRAAMLLLRRAVALVTSVVAFGLLLPVSAYWYDLWDFVVRSAFIFPALWVALSLGYRMLGGPLVKIRVVSATRPEVA